MHCPNTAGMQIKLIVNHLTPRTGDSPEPLLLSHAVAGCMTGSSPSVGMPLEVTPKGQEIPDLQ